jgi:hypothetical protein
MCLIVNYKTRQASRLPFASSIGESCATLERNKFSQKNPQKIPFFCEEMSNFADIENDG